MNISILKSLSAYSNFSFNQTGLAFPSVLRSTEAYSVDLDPITGDDVINIEESNSNIDITGRVDGSYKDLLQVTLDIGGTQYLADVNSDGTFKVEIAGTNLIQFDLIKVKAIVGDKYEDTHTVESQRSYVTSLTAPISPNVIITEDLNNDGVIDNSELEDEIDYKVTVDSNTQIGSTLNITLNYTLNNVVQEDSLNIIVDQNILLNGFEASFSQFGIPEDGAIVDVSAIIIDPSNNVSPPSEDSAIVDTPIDPCIDPGVDAQPQFLWHLGANLTATEGPSDHHGKSNAKYGTDVNYSTSDLNDAIYIGYDGFDAAGKLIKSRWDGDFERDHEDGRALWNLETYAGNDLVHIREDQNAYTTAKLGSGNDTYYVQGEMDSVLSIAKTNLEARSFIYTEECHDTVVVGGNGDGKVTGWGIDGGRIFTGSGNDNVTVYGEMDDGGVIDLGAGRIEFALDKQAASTIDNDNNSNYLTITKNLGNAGLYDFGHVFGGLGDDHVEIGTFVEGASIIDLGDGNNSVKIGDDLDGQAHVMTGKGHDVLNIGDDTEDYSSIDLGDGDNLITIRSTIEDHSTINTGNGNDTLTVGYAIANYAVIDLGEGDNSITTGDDMDGHALLKTGKGNDVFNIGDDTEDYSIIDLGDGDNIINVADALEDHSSIKMGNGSDMLTIGGSTWNSASAALGLGEDEVIIKGEMRGDSHIDLGAGNDKITVQGARMDGSIEGGEGVDTLVLDYTLNNNLVSSYRHVTNATSENISGIEIIELSGRNALDISFRDIVDDLDREGNLYVKGNGDSKVDLGATNWNSDGINKSQMRDTDGGLWSKIDSETIDGTSYDVYNHSYSSNEINNVYIEQGVIVI